jgi:hypothetical protein
VPNRAQLASQIYLSYSDDQGRSWAPFKVISGSAAFCVGASAGGDQCDDNQGSVPTVNPSTGQLWVGFINGDTPDEVTTRYWSRYDGFRHQLPARVRPDQHGLELVHPAGLRPAQRTAAEHADEQLLPDQLVRDRRRGPSRRCARIPISARAATTTTMTTDRTGSRSGRMLATGARPAGLPAGQSLRASRPEPDLRAVGRVRGLPEPARVELGERRRVHRHALPARGDRPQEPRRRPPLTDPHLRRGRAAGGRPSLVGGHRRRCADRHVARADLARSRLASGTNSDI